MGKFYNRLRNFKLPSQEELDRVFASFSKKEWGIFAALALLLILSTLAIIERANKREMVEIPMRGGAVSEGIIGTPRFINPILASSPADLDMTELVYSGLMRKTADGTLVPDLAEKYDVSKDGLTYVFTLKKNAVFQNGKPVTADDVIFTVNEAKDSVIKSPRKVDWDGITAEKVDDRTIKFSLSQPFPSFLLSATIGIMPRGIWQGAPIELNQANISPVGSGPYKITNVVKESSGVITGYELTASKNFTLGEPYIETLNMKFYANEDETIKALDQGDVDLVGSITPLNADILKERNFTVISSVLPRVFGLFFNQNQNQIFTDKAVRSAINMAIDKDKIIQEVLFGYGTAIDGPIPPNMTSYENPDANTLSRDQILAKAGAILTADGWSKGSDGFLQKSTVDKKTKKKSSTELAFSISTGNAPELVKTADIIESDLAELGIKVDVKTFEVGNLNQNVIRPRQYDALLFGEIINRESDLFAFWHSSQRKDPGLNVAMYTNAKVDKLLEDAFTAGDDKVRAAKYADFETAVKNDLPAVFLYSPNFIYVVPKDLRGIAIDHLTYPADRFANVYLWYTKTESVWKIFSK